MAITAPAPVPHRRRRPPRSRYWLRRIMLLLLLLLPLALWRGWSFLQEDLPLAAEGEAPRVPTGTPVYVVVMGVDERTADSGRSDTLVLVRLDPDQQGASVINIPRDTQVTFKSGKHSKINAAYAVDGADFVTEVVSDLLAIPRPYYVKVNFQSFVEIVDQLGGVDLYVDKHYQYEDPYQDLSIDIPAGQQRLTGEKALHYVRLRYDGITNSDIARIERQQKFLEALKAKLASPSSWWRVRDLFKTMRKHVKTNIPEADQLKLAEALFKARGNMKMQTLPGYPNDATGDWLLDSEKWNEVVRSWTVR